MLVLGDIQGAATPDDVPPAARKALVDMREFLPFKSYKLLDAAWVMCCGQQDRTRRSIARPAAQNSLERLTQMLSQVLRGPEEQEYELKLMTSRAEGGRVFVRFSLFGGGASREVIAEAASRRRVAHDRPADRRSEGPAGAARETDPGSEEQIRSRRGAGDSIAKLEVEIRRVDREIEDLSARLAEGPAGAIMARAGVEPAARSSIIDTSFTMDVGETVVVGTSRLKGGSQALIALLTAVPPRGRRSGGNRLLRL